MRLQPLRALELQQTLFSVGESCNYWAVAGAAGAATVINEAAAKVEAVNIVLGPGGMARALQALEGDEDS